VSEYKSYSVGRTLLEHQRDEDIAEAVSLYLAVQEDPKNVIPGQEDLEMPEPLEWLYRLRNWREIYGEVPLRAGGLEDQPYRFTRDLEAALLGERRRETVRAANLRNKMEYEARK
jgi:hypothetical protein